VAFTVVSKFIMRQIEKCLKSFKKLVSVVT